MQTLLISIVAVIAMSSIWAAVAMIYFTWRIVDRKLLKHRKNRGSVVNGRHTK
jgi:hypothetical protein